MTIPEIVSDIKKSSSQVWIMAPHDESLWRPTVPLVVMLAVSETKNPRLLSAWMGVRWLSALNPVFPGWTGREIAKAAMISVDTIRTDLLELHRRNLITALPSGSRPRRYITDTALLAQLERASIDAYPALIARYTRHLSDTD